MKNWTSENLRNHKNPAIRELASSGDSKHGKSQGMKLHSGQEKTRPARREAPITPCIYLPITPVAKPRMTRSDKWKKRPCVLRYREYCDSLRSAWGEREFPAAGAHLSFHMPVPNSWSKKKKLEMMGEPHQQKPDVDNMIKAVLDALHIDDSHIYDIRGSKYWAGAGYIEVYLNDMRLAA